ncbi:hypothetical protein PsorP6_011444 [Peronosclerospora sorghi]|uniref:Uncharacterized protein n=1 Tax=Peronosclerospora sorghi TaxID=230839 RepID=A0ACC0WLD1_9STRA|nr:hypothetical protein PsorP6_011444 [Peronosclerospora sorghi]
MKLRTNQFLDDHVGDALRPPQLKCPRECLVSSDDDIWKREKTGKRFIRNDPPRPIRVKVRAFHRLQTRRDQRNQVCLVLDHSLSCRLSRASSWQCSRR